MSENNNFFLRRVIRVAPGESGYFSAPDEGLDPNLFNGDRLRPEVRLQIVQTLYSYLATHWTQPQAWCNAWLAGSGISYQWSAGRGNGDLDVLLGVDWPRFRQLNTGHGGISDRELATLINSRLRDELWPRTALTKFGDQTYETTWYINNNVDASPTGIAAIHAYAAYNLTADTWTIRPPKLPANPASRFPRSWSKTIDAEARTARQIIDRYNGAVKAARGTRAGTGAWTNAMAVARLAADQATALYDDIHLGRRTAFSDDGEGFDDWANFRWQSHKRNGIVTALRELAKASADQIARTQSRLYGRPMPDHDAALISALTWTHT